jgi:Ni/Co efflux regulator RcnB
MRFIFVLAVFALFASPLAAQDQPQKKDAAARKPQASQQSVAPSSSAQQGFVDEDGDGINDRVRQNTEKTPDAAQGQRLRQQRRDRFVDQDGDGIHDERCSGTGLRQGRRHGAMKGGGQ